MRNSTLCLFMIGITLSALACQKANEQGDEPLETEPGVVTGRVKDWEGNPISGAKVIMKNSLSSGLDYEGTTDMAGRYSVEVGVGSFIAYAKYNASFEGENYEYDLECNDNAPFNKDEVTVRNFTWRTHGVRKPPLTPGYFGGSVYIDRFPGDTTFSSHLISFTFTPIETIDGRRQLFIRRLNDDPARLLNVPVGRYRLTAIHDDGRVLKLRNLNNGEFVDELIIVIEPSILGQGNLFCWHCAAVEYRE